MATHSITLTVNGSLEQIEVSSNLTLLQLLREKLALTGTKNGCMAGECGACTVILNGEAVNSCMMLAVECEGAEVLTVEGLAQAGVLNPIQEALIEEGGVQCGFCTPGILMSSHALLERNPHPTEADIREGLVGNLCRCTGYLRIVEGIQKASKKMAQSSGGGVS